MENGPFEDVFPIENGIFHCYVGLPEGKCYLGSFQTKRPQTHRAVGCSMILQDRQYVVFITTLCYGECYHSESWEVPHESTIMMLITTFIKVQTTPLARSWDFNGF